MMQVIVSFSEDMPIRLEMPYSTNGYGSLYFGKPIGIKDFYSDLRNTYVAKRFGRWPLGSKDDDGLGLKALKL
jgi:hypothetical protein